MDAWFEKLIRDQDIPLNGIYREIAFRSEWFYEGRLLGPMQSVEELNEETKRLKRIKFLKRKLGINGKKI